jgi:hypothetical protein
MKMTPDAASSSANPPSRRALLAGAVGGIGAWAASALARANPVAAAAGDPIRMGRTNKASGTNTTLQTTSTGPAYRVNQNGTGVAIRGQSAGGNGAYLAAANANKFGVFARNTSATGGAGGAIRAVGGVNIGLYATSSNTAAVVASASNAPAVSASTNVDNAVQGVSSSGVGVAGISTTGTGVSGSGPTGVYGATDSNANGTKAVVGVAFAGSGTTHGVFGESGSTSGSGVTGFNSQTTGTTYGVLGQSNSQSGRGVYGFAAATTGTNFGVYAESASNAGRGLNAKATSTSGATYGAYAESASTGGRGVYGYASAASGTTRGVLGESNSATGAGVYGQNFAGGYGVYSAGHAAVVGNFDVTGTKNFKVDHPLDPANRYLLHHCTEGAEALTLYSGTVRLDARGAATVMLPAWFDGLNTHVRYQLTAVGTSMPGLYVAAKVSKNRFRIAGGAPRGEVSWQLTARRQGVDGPIEIEKPAEERGTYVNPTLYGEPETASLHAKLVARITEAAA